MATDHLLLLLPPDLPPHTIEAFAAMMGALIGPDPKLASVAREALVRLCVAGSAEALPRTHQGRIQLDLLVVFLATGLAHTLGAPRTLEEVWALYGHLPRSAYFVSRPPACCTECYTIDGRPTKPGAFFAEVEAFYRSVLGGVLSTRTWWASYHLARARAQKSDALDAAPILDLAVKTLEQSTDLYGTVCPPGFTKDVNDVVTRAWGARK
jgi:hypothetical protein